MESSTKEIKLNNLEDEHTTKETKETTTEEEGSIGFTSIKEDYIIIIFWYKKIEKKDEIYTIYCMLGYYNWSHDCLL
ncbi:hypothetical protein EB796_023803 [Bugula neritina]|uniref:Uncharacterized protein n=1 Tax=Bugula neritina TaxID=10212 RepID=A0A7J7IVE6_BUGNE|nr:hypothetical protein EB796_023803 [Bugula neritina]